jgi:hypothetical protein
MTEPLSDVWVTRDYPVLKVVAQHLDTNSDWIRTDQVATETGLSIAEVERAATALKRRGLVKVLGTDQGPAGFHDIAGAAYLITGLHPEGDNAIEQLVSLLRQASDQTEDEDERSRLRRAAVALTDASGKILTGVATAWMTGILPR